MAGLAGLAFDLVTRMFEAGLEAQEESELDECKTTLRKYKAAYYELKDELINSSAMVTRLKNTTEQQQSQLRTLRKEKRDLFEKWTVAVVRETTGGVASLEEYDAAMNDAAEESFGANE